MGRRLALITGGTSGIGFGAALKLAPDYDLALGYAFDTVKAEKAADTLRAQFPDCRVYLYQQTLAGHADAVELSKKVLADFPAGPAALVLSHGRIRDGLFLMSEFPAHEAIISEHLVSSMALCHVFLKSMYRERFGRIVLLSSISAKYAKRGQSNYAAAKAGLEAFARTLALEVAQRGITVNSVAPGLIETPMTEAIVKKLSEGEVDIRKRIPAGYVGSAEDVGETIAFLCSEKARYVTGTVLTVDGGRSLGDPQS